MVEKIINQYINYNFVQDIIRNFFKDLYKYSYWIIFGDYIVDQEPFPDNVFDLSVKKMILYFTNDYDNSILELEKFDFFFIKLFIICYNFYYFLRTINSIFQVLHETTLLLLFCYYFSWIFFYFYCWDVIYDFILYNNFNSFFFFIDNLIIFGEIFSYVLYIFFERIVLFIHIFLIFFFYFFYLYIFNIFIICLYLYMVLIFEHILLFYILYSFYFFYLKN